MVEKEKITKIPAQDRSVHRTFQIGALLIVGYILYSLYSGEGALQPQNSILDTDDARSLTDAEIDTKVREKIAEMTSTQEFKDIKEFVNYTSGQLNPGDGKILKVNNGILIYVPAKMIPKEDEYINVENEDVRLAISTEKIKKAPVTPEVKQVETKKEEKTAPTLNGSVAPEAE